MLCEKRKSNLKKEYLRKIFLSLKCIVLYKIEKKYSLGKIRHANAPYIILNDKILPNVFTSLFPNLWNSLKKIACFEFYLYVVYFTGTAHSVI